MEYRNPVTGKRIKRSVKKWGFDVIIQTAREANERMPKHRGLLAAFVGNSKKISDVVPIYWEEILSQRSLAAGTRQNIDQFLHRIDRDLGNRVVQNVTVKEVADYLHSLASAHQSNRLRSLLVELFKISMSRGITDINPADATRKRIIPPTTRRRLSKAILVRISLSPRNIFCEGPPVQPQSAQ